MSDSILIEVDQMSRQIMEELQSRIETGNYQSFTQIKTDIVTPIESIQRTLKQYAQSNQRSNEDMKEQIDLLQHDLSQLQRYIGDIAPSIHAEVQAATAQWQTLITPLDERMHTILTTIDQLITQVASIPSLTVTIHELQNQSQHLDMQLSQQSEQMSQLMILLHEQQQQQLAAQQLLLEKITKVEADIAWNSRSLFKKWFGGRKRYI